MTGNTRRIAIAVADDGQTIAKGMLGRAASFLIVDVDPNGREIARQLRPNPYQNTLQRGKTFDVADFLTDCQTLICRRIGKRGIPRMEERGFELVFTKKKDAEAALEDYLRGLTAVPG